ncbi:GntR family transcriptional regulator [Pseudomonas putida]|nr:GntR family transcriptional regulator [Pseudomonas putida]
MNDKEIIEFLSLYWHEAHEAPKYEKLHGALTQAINDGFWAVGQRLPAEADWVRNTPCGLATVQRAFRALVDDGIIERRRGSGTTVASRSRTLSEPWHMRFLRQDSDSEYLSISTRVLNRRLLKTQGEWSTALGQTDQPVIRLTRVMYIANELEVFNTFYARADLFPELITEPLHALDGKNIKRFITGKHKISIQKIRHRLKFGEAPKWFAEARSPQRTATTLILNAVATQADGSGIYYQDFYLPHSNFILELGTEKI